MPSGRFQNSARAPARAQATGRALVAHFGVHPVEGLGRDRQMEGAGLQRPLLEARVLDAHVGELRQILRRQCRHAQPRLDADHAPGVPGEEPGGLARAAAHLEDRSISGQGGAVQDVGRQLRG